VLLEEDLREALSRGDADAVRAPAEARESPHRTRSIDRSERASDDDDDDDGARTAPI
jgi:hypothetical protein